MSSSEDRSLSVLMDEYRSLADDIGRRVQLQQHNTNIAIVLLTAFTGYLFTYWSDHSLQELEESEIACLVVVAPMLGLVYIWRHVDHDSNIIDKASYIVDIIRPKVAVLTGDPSVMSFESWLREGRFRRVRFLTPLAVFGMEHLAASAYITTFGIAAWYLRIGVPGRAGEAGALFDVLLYIGTGLYVVSMYMAGASTYRYTLIAASSTVQVPVVGEPHNNQADRFFGESYVSQAGGLVVPRSYVGVPSGSAALAGRGS